MWATMIAVIVLVTTLLHGTDEPSEAAMRRAFTRSVSDEVRAVLDFVGETEGTVGIARIRRAGTALFEIRSFTKHDCTRLPEGDHHCGFAVEVGTVAGPLQQTLRGRFRTRPGGLAFFHAA
ncbi:hypothetical protein [Rhodoplanes roseus]|uniref:Uncharacterized protein n=1 Tax=Rhodoplanes roseus TaxID=29409 RepID=A0A327KPJ8_9BRAD|nr:hypothetical protein [Rhodoplanes roseus]RAI40301.1 hypothetical protein CH341_24050 [Rhodoplanes roseus]